VPPPALKLKKPGKAVAVAVGAATGERVLTFQEALVPDPTTEVTFTTSDPVSGCVPGTNGLYEVTNPVMYWVVGAVVEVIYRVCPGLIQVRPAGTTRVRLPVPTVRLLVDWVELLAVAFAC
jgi:hypothetical protein